MRKIIVIEFVSLDGVIQAPGGPDEDRSGSFQYGGWSMLYGDETTGEALKLTYGEPYDLMLGRRTYDIFASYWPKIAESTDPDMNEKMIKFAKEFDSCTKFVATHRPESLEWKNSKSLGHDLRKSIEEIKSSSDKNILVVGSSELVHTLLKLDLVDELHLHITPIILGKGKRLFDENSKPRALKLSRSAISKSGVLLMNYSRDGEIKTQ